MGERSGRFHPLLAGAALGVSFGGCLLGLNPELLAGLGAPRVLAFGALLGALLASPFCLRAAPPSGAASWLALAAGFALMALFAERQRSLYYLFVPNGGRRVLVAVAVLGWCASALLVAAALTRPRARPAGRLLLGLLLLFAVAPVAGRRAVEAPALATPVALPRTARRSLLVIGVEGLSYERLTAWARDGSLPVFARLLAGGSSGALQSLVPYERVALWGAAATGKRPSKSGILSAGYQATPFGALRLTPRLPGGGALRLGPFHAEPPQRHARTFWEVLAARDHEASLLNWPGAHPARDGLVLWASERLFDGDERPDAARPPEAAARARLFRLGPQNLDHALVRTLVPEGASAAARQALLAAAARDLSVVGAALGAVPTGPLNAAALVLSGLAEASPGLGGAGGEAALHAYYRFLDDTLGELLNREGKERTLCLFAPVSWGTPPPLLALSGSISPEASRDGFVVLYGSGIRAGAQLSSAQVLDLTPTLLVLAGEPIARDMDGRVLAEAFDERFRESASIPIVDSFEPEGPSAPASPAGAR